MNQDNTKVDEASAGHPARPESLSVGRRRFAKGLAPAVLGTLASKPVLGAQYICTVSGHASGNASAHIIQGVRCDSGKSPSAWEDTPNWPGVMKGGLPNKQTCQFTGGPNAQGTVFNGHLGLLATFFYSTVAGSGCAVGLTSGTGFAPASMRQVLGSTDTQFGQLHLGRVVVASLLNAADPMISYPVSADRIVAMFNAVVNGGLYSVESVNLHLNREDVIEYLERLYPPLPPSP